MKEEEYGPVIVTPEMWEELFTLIAPVMKGLGEWGERHDLPLTLPIGALLGAADGMAALGGGCDCDVCVATAETFAEEVAKRIIEVRDRVQH
jgi:hypothetical protein